MFILWSRKRRCWCPVQAGSLSRVIRASHAKGYSRWRSWSCQSTGRAHGTHAALSVFTLAWPYLLPGSHLQLLPADGASRMSSRLGLAFFFPFSIMYLIFGRNKKHNMLSSSHVFVLMNNCVWHIKIMIHVFYYNIKLVSQTSFVATRSSLVLH